ncbi:DUF6186 family protein [Blastococcus brunescens]|uniref:DUF6186 family protein n=1 Tax=Blastococcus brunescens TaxID=1564165 RepID=A0ABZ1B703_9ACTN|nr:DUF6186 family protein [Blastococcus sp. BMG 8361]WRL66566.1 DUF6186 family protein [Blastococcus sp. BMG 8361]
MADHPALSPAAATMSDILVGVLAVVALAVAGAALEVSARRGRGGATVAQAIGAAMRTTPGRVTVLAAWLWLGVHFLAR